MRVVESFHKISLPRKAFSSIFQPEKTLKGKFFKHFHYAPAQKSFQFEFPQFSSFSFCSLFGVRHTDEKKKFKHSRDVVEFQAGRRGERLVGRIFKINLIIAIAITESVASHKFFSAHFFFLFHHHTVLALFLDEFTSARFASFTSSPVLMISTIFNWFFSINSLLFPLS